VGEQREQNRAEEGVLGASAHVRASVDSGGGLATQHIDSKSGVAQREQPPTPRLDVTADERTVLVERRPPTSVVLLEGDLDLGARLDVADEKRECAEAEPAEGRMQLRSAHTPGYALLGT